MKRNLEDLSKRLVFFFKFKTIENINAIHCAGSIKNDMCFLCKIENNNCLIPLCHCGL